MSVHDPRLRPSIRLGGVLGDLEPNQARHDVKDDNLVGNQLYHFVPLLRAILLLVHWSCPAVTKRSSFEKKRRGPSLLPWQSQFPCL